MESQNGDYMFLTMDFTEDRSKINIELDWIQVGSTKYLQCILWSAEGLFIQTLEK